MTLLKDLQSEYQSIFGEAPTHLVHAPGRVNLIGDHTDYNDGFVMPLAIEYGIWFAFRPRQDDKVLIHSMEFDSVCEFSLSALEKQEQYWGEYAKGVAWALIEQGHQLQGWEGVIVGNIPKGAGLSSSAALEVGVAKVFAVLSDLDISAKEIALRSQYAENNWIGVQCGIMDQMIVAAGTEQHALLIDCRDLGLTQVPMPTDAAVVILDTATRRGLVDSAYNERREQCQKAAEFYGKDILRDVTPEMLNQEDKPEALIYQRAKHVVMESARTLEASEAMRAGDSARLGELMYSSHVSLRDDFEVSSNELNAIVEAAMAAPGCLGARMTGAGFGGCAVALVRKEEVATFCDTVAKQYQADTGKTADIYSTQAAQGAYKMS